MDEKMKQATGNCKYCGQNMMVQVPEHFTQADIDEHISLNCCHCAEGEDERLLIQADIQTRQTLKEMCHRDDNEEPGTAENTLLKAIKDLRAGDYLGISVRQLDGSQISETVKDDGKIKVKYSMTITEENTI